MRRSSFRFPLRARALCVVAAVALVLGCARDDEQPRTPLDQIAAQGNAGGTAVEPGTPPPSSALSDSAKSALARGNDAMRAKRYEAALAEYRAAASASPHNPAPYFGIQMAARQLGNGTLADSAARMIRALSAPGDSAKTDPHSLPPGHPTVP